MLKFKTWLESENWFDFQRERGQIPVGHMQYNRSMPEMPISHTNYEVKDITDIKLLHDRILDSIEFKPKDLSVFIKSIIENVPNKNEPRLDKIANNINYELNSIMPKKKNLYISHMIIIDNLEELLKRMNLISKENSPNGEFFKEVLPLMRNVFKRFKEDNVDYQKYLTKKRLEDRQLRSWSRSRR